MKLWLLTQDVNNGYDTYDSAIVAADTYEEAQNYPVGSTGKWSTWAKPSCVKVTHIGEATPEVKRGLVLASFNAG